MITKYMFESDAVKALNKKTKGINHLYVAMVKKAIYDEGKLEGIISTIASDESLTELKLEIEHMRSRANAFGSNLYLISANHYAKVDNQEVQKKDIVEDVEYITNGVIGD